jgi:hypothetical protein
MAKIFQPVRGPGGAILRVGSIICQVQTIGSVDDADPGIARHDHISITQSQGRLRRAQIHSYAFPAALVSSGQSGWFKDEREESLPGSQQLELN